MKKMILIAVAGLLLLAAAWVALYSVTHRPSRLLFYDRFDRTVLELRSAGKTPRALHEVQPLDSSLSSLFKERDWYVEPLGRNLLVTQVLRTDSNPSSSGEWRRYQVFSPNGFGGYDLIGAVHYMDFKELEGSNREKEESLRTLAEWRKGQLPVGAPIPEAWIPLPDPRVLEFLAKAKSDPKSAQTLIDSLIQAHPENLLLRVFAIDLAVLQKDPAGVTRLLGQYEPILESGNQPLFSATPAFYHEWLKYMEREQQKGNLFSRLASLFQELEEHPPSNGLARVEEVFQTARYDDIFFAPASSLFLSEEKASPSSFLEMQVTTKVTRVLAEFRLFQGDPEGALRLIFPCHRIGVVDTRSGRNQIVPLIGTAMRAIATASIETAYLSGVREAEEVRRLWPLLDEAYAAEVALSNDMKSPRFRNPLFCSNPSVADENEEEMLVRTRVTFARMALAHSATAARYRLMTTEEYPKDAADFAPLLPNGADPDPFDDSQKPLRIARSETRPFVLYSLGPDRADQNAAFSYDPTNGSISSGDLFTEVPRERKYPFPPPGKLATTRDAILAQFPNGLPPDPFAARRTSSYPITDTTPAWIKSWGPDTDQPESVEKKPPGELPPRPTTSTMQAIFYDMSVDTYKTWNTRPPPRYGVSTFDGRFLGYPNLGLQVCYDPTNGIVSNGDLYFCTAAPDRTALLGNLPPTPTPFH